MSDKPQAPLGNAPCGHRAALTDPQRGCMVILELGCKTHDVDLLCGGWVRK